ncbi:MAG: glycosidase [Cyclobacteriaceae bacterium]|nr:glycosidase [Cyclobacteriaceae bacterium]
MKWHNPVGLFTLLVLGLTVCTTSEHRNTFANDSTWALLPFEKVNDANPILQAGTGIFKCPILQQEVNWEEKDVFNPAAVVRNGAIYLFYRAEDTIGKYNGTSRIGLAISTDGVRFNRMFAPVLYPAEDFMKAYEWEGGIEDPRIIENETGTYMMTYTAYDGETARLCIASSTDLLNWVKHGLALKDKFINQWSKSGAIVGRQQGDKVIAEKISNKYWMYFGDTDLFVATSDDLIQWEPVLDETGNLKPVLKPRPGMFDSRLVESGPYALITEHGILLLYNGMNLDTGGDPNLPKGAYCSGQALFDLHDPTQVIDRMDNFFLRPDQPYETEGQVNQVCFIEGMIPFNGQWFLYYGTADSKIGVAVKEAESEKL